MSPDVCTASPDLTGVSIIDVLRHNCELTPLPTYGPPPLDELPLLVPIGSTVISV